MGKQFKDLGMNDKITIEMTVAEAVMALVEYGISDWEASATTEIFRKLQDKVMDPIYLKERQAAIQAHIDAGAWYNNLLTGQPPEGPPLEQI